MTKAELIDYLLQRQLIQDRSVDVISLPGGVSSEVTLVRTANRDFVVKRALATLKVADPWHSDPRRSHTECQAIQYATRFIPGAVPKILDADLERNLFVMEYFGHEYTPWKSQLMDGEICAATAQKMAVLLATIHNASWGNHEAESLFDTTDDFFALRIEPYLVMTGQRHPELQEFFGAETERLGRARTALVHGDFSAKNILVSSDRCVLLDWEVAWFGDPAFDPAFLLNLFYLKSLYRRKYFDQYLDLIATFLKAYAEHLVHFDHALECRICRLTLLLMLARIDGKSPAEYITSDSDRQHVRRFVKELLLDGVVEFAEVDARWRKEVAGL
ncbi:MAG: aminoglycoside phosphotransferase family protein [Pirellulales bacterium]|nr:aminoglycoside phosphotransferase family protein [Pirellulales bacterium]